jgi:hypothetical protein
VIATAKLKRVKPPHYLADLSALLPAYFRITGARNDPGGPPSGRQRSLMLLT